MYKFLKNVIFQEVLNILYFKIIPNISQKFDSNFGGPKLTHTLYSPLNLLYPRCFVPSLVEIDTVVLEKKMEMWKVYNNNNDNYDGQRTNFDEKNSLEPSALVS